MRSFGTPGRRQGAFAVLVLAALALGACRSKIPEELPPAPEPSSAKEPAAERQADVQHSIERAVRLLQKGESEAGDAELHAVLNEKPSSRSARFLIAQIETPIGKLFPQESFPVRLGKNQKLSHLASKYLGNPLAFYGLARFNGIAVPLNVHEGQIIRIPKTPGSLVAAQKTAGGPPLRLSGPASESELASLPPADAAAPADAPASQGKPAISPAQHRAAERFYRAGLIAFQRQDLDRAIAQWRKAVAADPGYVDARVSLAQAEKLKQNLRQLRK
ncbi:MAG: hypothetical protein JOY77_12680 [Alphaproteobacteria bacterium]|nr:hypothetical protein [Alphaproteobacteria bacterium]MBV9063765.1 hypothetical protein [Alphaproteobacteria bacterium]